MNFAARVDVFMMLINTQTWTSLLDSCENRLRVPYNWGISHLHDFARGIFKVAHDEGVAQNAL